MRAVGCEPGLKVSPELPGHRHCTALVAGEAKTAEGDGCFQELGGEPMERKVVCQ